MTTLINIGTIVGVALAAIIFLVIIFKAFWKVAGTNEVLIASGLGKVRQSQAAVCSCFPSSRRHSE